MTSRPVPFASASFASPSFASTPFESVASDCAPDPIARSADAAPPAGRHRGWLAAGLTAVVLGASLVTAPAALAQPSGAAPAVAPAGVAGPVKVDNAWVRATVSQQRSTGAFFGLTSTQRTRLVAVESPAADIVEVHEMALADNIMRMRAIDAIALEPGRRVELQPGGLHVMLIDLRKPVQVGDTIPLTLVFEDDKGKRTTQAITATARPLTTGSQDSHGGKDGHGGHGGHGEHGEHSDHGGHSDHSGHDKSGGQDPARGHGSPGDRGNAGAGGQTGR